MRWLQLFLLVLSSCLVHGQYLGFFTRVTMEVDAPVSLPDGGPPGPEIQAQLLRVMDDGTMLPLLPVTTFQTNAADPRARYYVKPVIILVPDIVFADIFADPIEIRVVMRAWRGPDWLSSRFKGESEPVNVLLRNLLYPPANMVGLKGFTLEAQPRIGGATVSADGLVQLAATAPGADSPVLTVERSTDLVQWHEVGQFATGDGKIAFNDSDFQTSSAGFFRVRYP